MAKIKEDENLNKGLTFGQKAVGLTFNPSGDEVVHKTKQVFAELIDMVEEIKTQTYLGNTFKGMAIRSLVSSQMAVVKFITWRD